jgi:hypothetical protein
VLLTPSWELAQGSLFARWPLTWLRIGTREYPVGVLVFIPVVAALAWLLARLLERPRRRWQWGPLYTALPLAGLGALILARAAFVASPQHQAEAALAVGLLWGVYLYVVQDWPAPWAQGTLALVTLVQGVVAIGQFLLQHSLGLAFLGEPVLDPQVAGVCVIESLGQRWLRAYGLAPHPDVLGGYLGLGLLVCLGAMLSSSGWRRRGFGLCLAAGGLGLFFSFSRSAWLAALAGLGYLLVVARPWRRADRPASLTRQTLLLVLVVLAIVSIALGIVYGNLLVSRFLRLGDPLERRSIQDRQTDIGQVWALIREVPLTGVGPGRYLEALWERAGADPPLGFRRVYNIPLLAAAELGIPGALLWLWMVLSSPLVLALGSRRAMVPALRTGWAAALVAVAVIAMFHHYLYMLPGWWYSLYPALLIGLASREEPCAC